MTAPIAVHTVVIGGGQAGLAAGYHLARRSRDFVILDAAERTGDSWRHRWDFADTVRMLRGPCAC
ncbi:MAG: FAD-dependent oxidoreductase, partial [Actinomycetota bacterium]|nr:FAD-dependent oxidoreductase [Actinomycetota bacterium]